MHFISFKSIWLHRPSSSHNVHSWRKWITAKIFTLTNALDWSSVRMFNSPGVTHSLISFLHCLFHSWCGFSAHKHDYSKQCARNLRVTAQKLLFNYFKFQDRKLIPGHFTHLHSCTHHRHRHTHVSRHTHMYILLDKFMQWVGDGDQQQQPKLKYCRNQIKNI